MLVAVVVIYVICWGPMLIDNVLMAYDVLPFIRTGSLKYMGTAFHLMAYFNRYKFNLNSINWKKISSKVIDPTTNKPSPAFL